jgi:transposase
MTKMTDDTIGIDVSKATLDVHRLSDGKMTSFSNDTAGFKPLAKFCNEMTVIRVVYEATGAYHKGLERALGAHLPLVKVNPLQARRFAQAQGVRAKTDAVDARMLAVMGDAFGLGPMKPISETQHVLKELRAFRSGLITDRTRILSRQKTQTLPITRRQSRTSLARIDKQIAEIGAEIGRLIQTDDTMAHSMKILRSIPGIGEVCAATILIEMPEIGDMDRKQVASLTGVAPMTRQSGQWRGKSFIQGGRKVVRDAL